MSKNEPNFNITSDFFDGEFKHVVSRLREIVENDFKIGQILFENRSILSPEKLGSLLGNKSSKQLLQGYLSQFEFKNAELGPLLKDLLEKGGFELPQVHEMIANILEAFANEYIDQNPDNKISANPEDIVALVYGVLLLNTDLTSPSIKQKMGEKEFVHNMLDVGSLKTLHDEIKVKEKKLSELMNKKSIDRDQKDEIQSLLVGYQQREKQLADVQNEFRDIYQFVKENPLKFQLSKDLKKEKHHHMISRTLSMLFPEKHFKRVMMRPKHTNKELNKSNRPKNN